MIWTVVFLGHRLCRHRLARLQDRGAHVMIALTQARLKELLHLAELNAPAVAA